MMSEVDEVVGIIRERGFSNHVVRSCGRITS